MRFISGQEVKPQTGSQPQGWLKTQTPSFPQARQRFGAVALSLAVALALALAVALTVAIPLALSPPPSTCRDSNLRSRAQ